MLAGIAAVLLLAGLTAYAVLGGADFGTGIWDLTAGRGRSASRIRALLRTCMGPVWEANHVWLIFTLVVFWTSFPAVFAAVMSTMYIPLFLAAAGIILRGSSYAFRSHTAGTRFEIPTTLAFGVASILTPFFLGAVVGGVASGRVPLGNSAGDPVTAWWNPTSIAIGLLAVVTGAYMAAVFTAADSRRLGEDRLAEAFRIRALIAGVVAGTVAIAALVVVRSDAPSLFHGLTSGAGLAVVIVSLAAGVVTLWLVFTRRAALSRWTGALAVAAVVAGWALAQQPYLLPPNVTVDAAAAPDATLWALMGTAVIFVAVVGPSLVLLYRLSLAGKLGNDLPPADEGAAGA